MSKRIQVTLIVPSVERDGVTDVDQVFWVEETLYTMGKLFGGATALPPSKGVWLDPETKELVYDKPVLVTSYVEPSTDLTALKDYANIMKTKTHQGEVALLVDNDYVAI